MSRPVEERGFTLVEVLVVMMLLGLVMTAVMGHYISSQRTADTQAGLVDVQQNLRIALDCLERDIRRAGFLVAKDTPPIELAAQNALTMNVALSTGTMAIVADEFVTPDDVATMGTVSLRSANPFAINSYVRIVRPADHKMPIERILQVDSTTTGATVKLTGFDEEVTLREGDMVLQYVDPNDDSDGNANTPEAGITAPSTIGYALNGDLLERSDPGNPGQDVATGITSVTFAYLMDDGSEQNSIPALSPQREDIRAVRVTLVGSSTSAEGVKSRQLSSVIMVRNR